MFSLGFFRDRKIVVTGGIGSVGREIVDQLLALGVGCVRVVDNNESGVFDLEQEWAERGNVEFFHCDITNPSEMQRVFAGMELCFHAAALKHVPSCERSPFSALHVNVNGIENVIKAALHHDLERVLFTSSDKAVNPTNVMGTSKLMGERLFTAMNAMAVPGRNHTVFASTRFGNVAGSRGSVIPLFLRQIEKGGPVTLTDERMTRFVMSNADAVQLVLRSMAHARGGEIFITKMPVLRIVDLAEAMIRLIAPLFGHSPSRIDMKMVGQRPGEKLWEELSTDEESRRIYETDDYLIVFPPLASDIPERAAAYGALKLRRTARVYHSEHETKMTADEIERFLMKPGVLPSTLQTSLRRGAADATSSRSFTIGAPDRIQQVRDA